MPAKALMVLGTSSGVGKSFITAGLCRLLSNWGLRVAPFKAQNMSNNSFVTEDGGEIGRAQAVQAECARVKPSVEMNPVLLKPSADDGSQVIIRGKAIGHFKARDYFGRREMIAAQMREAYEKLARDYDVIVIEGAGSPAEVNLKKNDLVNMHTAEMADAQCLLVADIDRGGVFASLIGTLDLLAPAERGRIAGLLINKFRGDQTLFEDGVQFLEKRTGKKVWGVIPYDRSLWIEEEDSLSLSSEPGKGNSGGPRLDIAVILLPRMSNFTDFDALRFEPTVSLRYVKSAKEIGNPDLLILPGTKSTIADLEYLEREGFCSAILDFSEKGGRILGICGGYQMLGQWILDSCAVESSRTKIQGLGLFQMTTEFQPEKVLRRVSEKISVPLFGGQVEGSLSAYEIHLGVTRHGEPYAPFGSGGAVSANGRIAGTYYHGLFDEGSFRQAFLQALAQSAAKEIGSGTSFSLHEIKEIHYNRLAQMLEQNLDLAALRQSLGLEVISK